jgi:diaminohydroxyphosphoribosylaminopyrimidine deaminase / 5-amino-6-(5-phosphoribosylamino)uracil reductase
LYLKHCIFAAIHLQLTIYEKYMQRCIELARQGAGSVAPNPMVGAVLVYNDLIIAEGYHAQYGQAHAEVNCINAVTEEHLPLLTQSTLYVSLEPCTHFGKTPPCADLIIKKKIPKVVIGCRDPFKEVDGKGIEKLKAAGIEVISGVLEAACKDLNKRFFCFHTMHRPYIILKWAQTANGVIANKDYSGISISNEFTNRLVHKWRSEEAAILVGTNTALADNPSLTTRLWTGNNPVRLVVDMNLRLPQSLKLFDGEVKTIVFNTVKQEEKNNLLFCRLTNDTSLVHQTCNALYKLNIQSVLVEGGAKLLQSFIDEGLYDEVRIITNNQLQVPEGITAPRFGNLVVADSIQLKTDTIHFYKQEMGSQ